MSQRVLDKQEFLSRYRKKYEVDLARNNPLRRLDDRELIAVFACLTMYLSDKEQHIEFSATSLKETRMISEEAALLGERISRLMWKSKPWDQFRFLKIHRILPPLLSTFSKSLSGFVDLFAKKASDNDTGRDFLICASLILRSSTGSFHDEHLAEVIQLLPRPKVQPYAPGRPVSARSELSGDAIRKKRDRLRRSYPQRYKFVCDMAHRMCPRARHKVMSQKEREEEALTSAYAAMLAESMDEDSDLLGK